MSNNKLLTLDTSAIAYPAAPFSIEDEYLFWTHQISEHALFLALSMNAETLATIGRSDLRENAFSYYWDAGQRVEEFIRKESFELDDTFNFLSGFEQYLNDLFNVVNGQWIGYVYPSIVTHYLLELQYLQNKLTEYATGQSLTTADEEIRFWQKLAADHAAVIARLLDPSEIVRFKNTVAFSELFNNLLANRESDLELESMVLLTLENNETLNQIFGDIQDGILSAEVQSVIHPALIAHIIREGERANLKLQSLNA